jgi:rubrerythrin
MAIARSIILRSVGRGAGGSRFPWAGRPPREPRRREEPVRYRCSRCRLPFRMAGLPRPCPKCGGPAIARSN